MRDHRSRLLIAGSAGLLLAAILILNNAALPAAARLQSSRRKKPSAKVAKKTGVNPAAMPFRVGEVLNYQASWAAFTGAATVQLSVPERRNFFGWSTWHLRAQIHTMSPVRSLFAIDDQFDSYMDATTLETRQYEMYFDELGKKHDRILRFVPKDGETRIPGPGVVVLPGTRDPLDAFYALRAVDWQKTPQETAAIYDGQNIYEMRARLEAAQESVALALRNYSALRISIHLFQYGKEVPEMNFLVWLAHDPARTPVRIQADLPFGSVRADLTSPSQ